MTAIETPYEAPSATSDPLSWTDRLTVTTLHNAIMELDCELDAINKVFGSFAGQEIGPSVGNAMLRQVAKCAGMASTLHSVSKTLRERK